MSESTMKPEALTRKNIELRVNWRPRDFAIHELNSNEGDDVAKLEKAIQASGLTRKTVLKIRREIKAKLPINKDAIPEETHAKPVFNVSLAQYLVVVTEKNGQRFERVQRLEDALYQYEQAAANNGATGAYLSVILREFTK